MTLTDLLAQLPSGFSSAEQDSQQVFASVMNALARPALIGTAAPAGMQWPEQIDASMAAMMLALPGAQTPIWLSEAISSDPIVGAFAQYHSGCQIVAAPRMASYAFLHVDDLIHCSLSEFAVGTDIDPHLGATLVMGVNQLANDEHDADAGVRLNVTGPGVKGEARLTIDGLPANWVNERIALTANFPRGVEMIFCHRERLAALPRSSSLRVH